MGWSEGQALGKGEDGRVEPVSYRTVAVSVGVVRLELPFNSQFFGWSRVQKFHEL